MRPCSIKQPQPDTRPQPLAHVPRARQAWGGPWSSTPVWAGVLSIALAAVGGSAQSPLRESIRQLDRDRDGSISPEEMNDRVRRYLDPIAEARGIRLDRPVSIERLEEAIERYERDERRRRGRFFAPGPVAGPQGFRPAYEDPLVPEFGPGEVRVPYSRRDLREAERTLSSYDRNGDGYIDRNEAWRIRWTGSDPFTSDLDGDGRLSRLELAQRYALQRQQEDRADPQRLLAGRLRSGADQEDDLRRAMELAGGDGDGGRSGRSSRYLAYSVLQRYDRNRNGRLEENEWLATGIDMGEVDLDNDGIVSRSELEAWIDRGMDRRANDYSDVLPEWFYDRDLDGDGQISMAEFTDVWDDEKLREFSQLDADGDGFLTFREMMQSKAVVGGSYASDKPEILMPGGIALSEIDISDDVVIGKLQVRLSITHTYVGHLDAFLVGPGGERVELFTEVGRSDDHFDNTLFDDSAGTNITRGRAPFRGTFQPEAVSKRQPGLSRFRGESTRGVWQLMVRSTRSDRAGILHYWSLTVEPEELEDPDRRSSSAEARPAEG